MDRNVLDFLENNSKSIKESSLKNTNHVLIKFSLAILLIILIFIFIGFFGKTAVPVAKYELKSGTYITDEMITFKNIPRYKLLNNNIIYDEDYLIGKYVLKDVTIYKDSYFINSNITEEKSELEKPENIEEQIIYNLTIESSYYNAFPISKNDKINLYFVYWDERIEKEGILFEAVNVIDIKDKSGYSIFDNSVESDIYYLQLAVGNEEFKTLKRIEQDNSIKVLYTKEKHDFNYDIEDLEEYLERE